MMGRGNVPESGTEVVQQRLDQTSTSLEAALKAVEKKLNQEDNTERQVDPTGSAVALNHIRTMSCFIYLFQILIVCVFLCSVSNSVRSAGTILDDIGNMFDDLADQLDAMLE